VMLGGFFLAIPFVLGNAGGFPALVSPLAPPWFGDLTYSSGPGSGWTLFVLLAPAFVVSPGLIQKSWAARSERALRAGIALNAVALVLFAFLPVLLGMAARVTMPGIEDVNTVLPTVLKEQLPPWIGALALAAVFSTEVDTCDAILFMISTSASKDLYKRFLRPTATDAELLRVARLTAVGGGLVGVALAIVLRTVIGALTIFYSLLVVTLFVPVLGGLYIRRATGAEALAAIVSGVTTMFVFRYGFADYRWLDPTLAGLLAAAIAFGSVLAMRKN
jgi:SSS family solute:Na+ symporter